MTISRDNFSRAFSVVAETRRQWSEAEKQAIIAEAARPASGLRPLENALELPIIFSMLRGHALTRVSRRNSWDLAVSRRR
ncbi:MAG: hypothetical protein P8Y47_03530 [Alphaproteobacteria bacterium]